MDEVSDRSEASGQKEIPPEALSAAKLYLRERHGLEAVFTSAERLPVG